MKKKKRRRANLRYEIHGGIRIEKMAEKEKDRGQAVLSGINRITEYGAADGSAVPPFIFCREESEHVLQKESDFQFQACVQRGKVTVQNFRNPVQLVVNGVPVRVKDSSRLFHAAVMVQIGAQNL